jgi:tetrahydromethanopterin S-methyltransferase subunit G
LERKVATFENEFMHVNKKLDAIEEDVKIIRGAVGK